MNAGNLQLLRNQMQQQPPVIHMLPQGYNHRDPYQFGPFDKAHKHPKAKKGRSRKKKAPERDAVYIRQGHFFDAKPTKKTTSRKRATIKRPIFSARHRQFTRVVHPYRKTTASASSRKGEIEKLKRDLAVLTEQVRRHL